MVVNNKDINALFLDAVTSVFQKIPFKQSDKRRVGVAVSGGADSMALLYLLSDWAKTNDAELHVFTVDHCLRQESADEAQFVKEHCGKLGVICEIITLKNLAQTTKAIQEKARIARYNAMAEKCCNLDIKHLFLGHHGDDQEETFFMRLLKGSGLKGLGAMEDISFYNDLVLCRPLLGISKADLLNYLGTKDIPFKEDPSNDKDEYLRVRIRKLLTGLKDEGLETEHLNLSLSRLQKADQALDEVVSHVFKNTVTFAKFGILGFSLNAFKNNPEEIQIRFLEQCLRQVRHDFESFISRQSIETLLDNLKSSQNKPLTLFGCFLYCDEDDVYVGSEGAQSDGKKAISGREILIDDRIIVKDCNGYNYRAYQEKDAQFFKNKLSEILFKEICPLPFRKTIPVIVDENDEIITSGFHNDGKVIFLCDALEK